MPNEIKDKLESTIKNNPPTQGNIDEWQAEELDESSHIEYDPADKSHLEAILADINEDGKEIEEFLKKEHIVNKLLPQGGFDAMSDLAGISFGSQEEAVKEKNHREDLKRRRDFLSSETSTKGK